MKKVLFICIKNTSRSPMAEALAAMLAPGWEVYSAGMHPGKEPNPEAVRAMKELGCDISKHRPKHVSDFQKITFDLVAKMDAPDVSDFVTAKWIENWDVPDPANGGIEEFRKVRDMLAERVRKLAGGEQKGLSKAA
ncbi:MAG TPA: low molecular weight phosphatase family protein [Burkholderiales bacterium]|jgi:protein-tyrosine-phosphatase|nr:low molecular weight phosphatase family protein [Burkholderiales bacterium]